MTDFRKSTVYQIYPRSFYDTNGDGFGDLKGVTAKLDYIKELGVDYIWMTPFFVSPQYDNGYDVEDYYNIDPRYGKMEDFEELYKYVKSHGLIEKKKVIMQVDIAFEKMLISSVGKCESIRDIVCHEYKHMNRELKLLILTDYIKGEYEKAIGDDTMSVHALGAVSYTHLTLPTIYSV